MKTRKGEEEKRGERKKREMGDALYPLHWNLWRFSILSSPLTVIIQVPWYLFTILIKFPWLLILEGFFQCLLVPCIYHLRHVYLVLYLVFLSFLYICLYMNEFSCSSVCRCTYIDRYAYMYMCVCRGQGITWAVIP